MCRCINSLFKSLFVINGAVVIVAVLVGAVLRRVSCRTNRWLSDHYGRRTQTNKFVSHVDFWLYRQTTDTEMDLLNDSFKSCAGSVADDVNTGTNNTSSSRFGQSQLAEHVKTDVQTASTNVMLNNQLAKTVSIAAQLLTIEYGLSSELNKLNFSPPVAYVYNPLVYASDTHSVFVSRYGNTKKKVLFVGMNPGPWGMVQTGVPFGAIKMVEDWLGIAGLVGKPEVEHPQRRVQGFECPRVEVSGQRFWGFFRDLCITPDKLFKNCFVYSYCPLSFMHSSGRNITPPELKSVDRQAIMELCDAALGEVLSTLGVEIVVGIGKFAEYRIRETVKRRALDVVIGCMLHPSPINPAANKGWNDAALKCLEEMNILHIVKGVL